MHFLNVPSLIPAGDLNVAVPRRFDGGPADWEATAGYPFQGNFSLTLHAVWSATRDAHRISWHGGKRAQRRADFKPASLLDYLKEMLGDIVLMQRRRLAGFWHGDENFGSHRVGVVHHRFTGMRSEAVARGEVCIQGNCHHGGTVCRENDQRM